MSINAKPWEGAGGAATVPDASETTKGKIRIATSGEAATGTDDLTAMTPAKVKARIDAALVGGVEYKGSYTGQSLVTAEKGDMYISSGNQTLGGISLTNGDHIIFNQDAADPVTGSMFDVIDNTDQVTSVNGQTNIVSLGIGDLNNVTISGGGAGGDLVEYDAVDGRWENVTKSTINVGDFNDDATYQLRDAGLTSIAGLTTSADKMIYATASDTYAVTDLTSAGRALLDDADASAQRTTLGLGTAATSDTGDFQPVDAGLTSISGLTTAADKMIYTTASDTYAVTDLTSAGRALLDDADASAQRTTLGLGTAATSASTDFQPIDAGLTSISGLTTAADKMIYTTASDTYAVADLTSAGRAILDDADASAQRTTLGLGTAATQDVGTSANNVVQLDGSSRLPAVDGSQLTNLPSGGLSAVVDDTTPQLGGALDVNGNAITSASNGDVTINPDGTGDISVGADIIPDANATHTIGDEDNRFISAYTDVNGAIRFKAKNDQGSAITKGQVVYIKGISGDVPTVGLARANSASTMPGFGLALANASDQAEVQIITFGNLTAYNTTTYSLSAGDTVYVSAATAGALTNSAPASETNLIQNIGKVIRASATEGIIKVGGAGRSAATPNLNDGKIFLGNASNQAVSAALSSINLTSFNDDLGSTYQPLDAQLTDVAGLTPADGAVIIGDGANFITESGATARASLGLTIGTDVQAYDAQLADVAGLTPADGAFIVGDGANFVTESGATARTSLGAIAELSEDSSPQLGGDLDLNGRDIVTTSNADLDLAPDGTGVVAARGNTTGGNNTGAFKLYCQNNSHWVGFKSPVHADYGTSIIWELPAGDGSANQVLETDGSGVLSWVDQSAGGAGTIPDVVIDGGSGDVSAAFATSGSNGDNERIYLINNGSTARTVTLPAVSGNTGRKFQIKRLGTADVTVAVQTGESLETTTNGTYVISAQYSSVTVACNASGTLDGWYII